MSYNSLSNIGNVANISKKNLPSPTSLAYYTGAASTSITETTGNISFSIATIAGSTTYISNFGNGSGTPTLYTISNLASNTPYGITLTAINSGNKSAPSTSFSILTKPAAPTSVAYVVGSATTVTGNVSFTAPTGTGVITSYIPSFGGVTGTTSPLNVTGLSINTSYSFTLKAANATGNSVDSSPAITLLTLPGPPTSLAYVANSATVNAVNVSFTAPTGNGVITGYIPSNGGVTGTASPITVSTLTSNTSYSFTMKSTNASGNSVDSSPALPILTLPDPPTALTYSATNLSTSSFSIAFTAPSGTGIITGYIPSTGGGTGTTSPFTVTGLASNTSYTITLRAKNASGNSAVSATSVTKLTLPDAPTIGTATVVNSTSVSVSFTAPGGTGSITSYTVTSSPGSFTGTGSTSPITVTAAFVSATAYTFTVTATNASGTSAASTATSPSVTPNSGGQSIVSTSLVINLDSTKGISSSTWTDQTGNGYNYTFYNSSNTAISYTTTTFKGNQVITLDGTSNYLWNSSGFGSHFKSSFTYEMWVYPKTTANTTLIYENGQSGFGGWSDDQMGTNSSGYFTSYVYNGGLIGGTSGGAYTLNTWYQVVNVYDNTASILYQYVNGALTAQVSIAKSYPTGSIYLVLGSQAGNGSSFMSGLGYFNGYIGQFRGYDIALSASQVLQNFNASSNLYYDGLTSATAAPSAAYLAAAGNTTNGVYWINLPTVGATQIYCILDRAADGGGWMMAMKAKRGTLETNGTITPSTTFQYSANYWTTVNTLNPTDTNRNDGESKFHTMNYSKATDIMALWPDITTSGGSLFMPSLGNFAWLKNNVIGGKTLINYFNTASNVVFDSAPRTNAIPEMGTVFSNQAGNQFYGVNFTSYANMSVRWGFAWNNESDWNSNDVTGGIGLSRVLYSAGDYVGCCEVQAGIKRSARVEMYIRDSTSAPSAPTIGTVTKSGSTVTVPFTVVTGASYYTAFSSSGGFSGSSTTTPITITGVATGTWTFTVKASNASGTSLASGTSSITV